MNSREQTLALVLIGAIVLIAAGAGGYFFVWQPLQAQRNAESALNQEIDDLDAQLRAQQVTAKNLAVARVRSLPADEAMARREYTVAMERLIELAGVPKGYTITPKAVDNSARVVPEISKGKPIYTRVAYEVVLKKVDMAMIKDFLENYYRLGLLQQITTITIKKDDEGGSKATNKRNDLTVILTTEAILVDGAESRRTLVPVPTAFAAVGGGALYKGMTATPEGGRGVTPPVLVPVLATQRRDYDLIVRKDPFNGPLPVIPPVPFALAKISDLKVNPDVKPGPVKVAVSGEGSIGARVTAVVHGDLFAEGELKVDPKTYAIDLPATSASEGSATVSVFATSADGSRTEKATFKVTSEPPPPPPVARGEDLSGVILLVGITVRSDGTAWARVLDNAQRYRYQIDATPSGVTVSKEYILGPGRPWKPDSDHAKLPAGTMQLSDTTKSTRTFKVVAVTADGLVISEANPGAGAKGPPDRMGPPRPAPAHANPIAAVGGNMAAAAPHPKYFRWVVGQPLAAIKPISEADAKLILKTAEANGPVIDVAVR
jgi:hypothetical protein